MNHVNEVTGQDSTTVDDAVSLTFKAGNALALTVDMGTGGDKLTLSGDRGAATIKVDNGDTVAGVITSDTANNVATADVYTGLKAGDKITTNATFSSTTVGDQLLTDTTLAAAAVKGTYADGTFTASAAGSDCLLQWADGTNAINSVVLVGAGSLSIAADNGADITFA